TLFAPLPAGFNAPVVPISFSFTDGSSTFSDSNSNSSFRIITDAEGQIVQWSVGTSMNNGLFPSLVTDTLPDVRDASLRVLPPASAEIFASPGVWIRTAFPTLTLTLTLAPCTSDPCAVGPSAFSGLSPHPSVVTVSAQVKPLSGQNYQLTF